MILPNKNKGHQIAPVTSNKPSIFNDDSDSDTPDSKPTGLTKTVKRQDKLDQNKAIEEDPTVYQYDEIYDEMDQRRKESKLSRKDLDKKPKYISRLLAAAEKRKRENERRIERQVQKEREEEGEQFKDKESFVTSAYRKKLEEMREQEELEKREEYLESIGDVRKQGNLDGFYRHLYDQKVNYEDRLNEGEVKQEVKDEPKSDGNSDGDEERSPKRRKSSESQSDSESKIKQRKSASNRKYRTRRDSAEEKSDEETTVKKEHLPSNLDADSDFSIDSSDSEDEEKDKEKSKENEESVVKVDEQKDNEKETDGADGDTSEVKESVDVDKEKIEEKPVEVKLEKPKIDIWKKRTVGEKFDEALRRYFERKAAREAGL